MTRSIDYIPIRGAVVSEAMPYHVSEAKNPDRFGSEIVATALAIEAKRLLAIAQEDSSARLSKAAILATELQSEASYDTDLTDK